MRRVMSEPHCECLLCWVVSLPCTRQCSLKKRKRACKPTRHFLMHAHACFGRRIGLVYVSRGLWA